MFKYSTEHRDELVRIIKFGLVGVVNTGVFFLFFFLFFNVIRINYLIATTFSYFIATVNSFLLNRRWTFESYGDSRKKFIKFVFVNVAAISVNSVMMFFLVDIIKFHPWFAQLLTICVTMCVNYLGNRFWTFYEETGDSV